MGCVKIFIFPKFALCGPRDFCPSHSVQSAHYYYYLWKEKSCWLFGSAYLTSFLKVFSFGTEIRFEVKYNPFIVRFVCWLEFMSFYFSHLPNNELWKCCVEKLNLMNTICLFFSKAVGGSWLFCLFVLYFILAGV